MKVWRGIGLFAVALALCGCASSRPTGPYFGLALQGLPVTGSAIDTAAREAGLAPEIVVFFLQWPASPASAAGFPRSSVEAIARKGALPCLTWEPLFYRGTNEVILPAEQILSGAYDPYLRQFAAEARAWGRPCLVRFAHEMNIPRYHWGTDAAGYGPRSPEVYRRMWRHVVENVRAAGATNLYWAFCPNADAVPNPAQDPATVWNDMAQYYPGDSLVDAVGLDGYNWGGSRTLEKDGWQSREQSFDEIFGAAVLKLRAVAPRKPMLVFETASVGPAGVKAQWLDRAMQDAVRMELKGVVWFQANKENDWRVRLDPLPDWARNPARPGTPAEQWIQGIRK